MDRYTSQPFLKRTIVFQFLRVVFGITSSAFCWTTPFAFDLHLDLNSHLICKNGWLITSVCQNILIRWKIYFLRVSFTENDDRTFLESKIKFISNDLKRVLWVEWDNQNNRFVFHYSSLIDLERSLERSKRNVLKLVHLFMIH